MHIYLKLTNIRYEGRVVPKQNKTSIIMFKYINFNIVDKN